MQTQNLERCRSRRVARRRIGGQLGPGPCRPGAVVPRILKVAFPRREAIAVTVNQRMGCVSRMIVSTVTRV